MACESKEDKFKLILSSFHSFHAFGDIELAILAKIVFMRSCETSLTICRPFCYWENEYRLEWQMRFVQCLQGMSRERLQVVQKYMVAMDYEHMNFYCSV